MAPPVTLVPGGDKVAIFANDQLPTVCKEIAKVRVTHGKGCGGYGKLGNEIDGIKAFRNEIVSHGGNAGVIQSSVPPHVVPFCDKKEHLISGFVFLCPDRALK